MYRFYLWYNIAQPAGVSKIRNRVIARVFRELDLIEEWGSRFRRILREAEDLGLPEPLIAEVGMSELAERLGHTTVSGELKKQVRNLLKIGYIEMTIPDKPKRKNQKYRLKAKGRAFLDRR